MRENHEKQFVDGTECAPACQELNLTNGKCRFFRLEVKKKRSAVNGEAKKRLQLIRQPPRANARLRRAP